jgi:hypothetical protein
MRLIPARPEQTQSPAQRFPLFADAGRRAADLWLECAPLSAGEWRDLRFRNYIAGLGSLDQFETRRIAFNEGFARGIARNIALPAGAGVCHA